MLYAHSTILFRACQQAAPPLLRGTLRRGNHGYGSAAAAAELSDMPWEAGEHIPGTGRLASYAAPCVRLGRPGRSRHSHSSRLHLPTQGCVDCGVQHRVSRQ